MTSTGEDAPDTRTGVASAFDVELNGLNTIQEHERKGRPRDLFWPWFGANVSVFGLSYGSFLLGFGISFWQATIVGVIGIVASFLLCGVISLAGKRGSAPTMVFRRPSSASFGVRASGASMSFTPLAARSARTFALEAGSAVEVSTTTRPARAADSSPCWP